MHLGHLFAAAVVMGFAGACCATAWAADPTTQPATEPTTHEAPLRLWEADAPGATGNAAIDIPTLTLFRPPAGKANGAMVLVCPGGGYGGLAEHEGRPIAEWLNSVGVTAAVLKYRLGPKYHYPYITGDALRAMRVIRSHATEWSIDPKRVGIIGFSAGGHLASTVATHFDDGDPQAADPIDRLGSRPDWAVLIYPVISFQDGPTHKGSRANLLGENADPALVEKLSNERQVTARTPPTFLVHSSDDHVVPVQNSLMFADALSRNNVSFELHVFDHGGHGFGLGAYDPQLGTWPADCARWMAHQGFLAGRGTP